MCPVCVPAPPGVFLPVLVAAWSSAVPLAGGPGRSSLLGLRRRQPSVSGARLVAWRPLHARRAVLHDLDAASSRIGAHRGLRPHRRHKHLAEHTARAHQAEALGRVRGEPTARNLSGIPPCIPRLQPRVPPRVRPGELVYSYRIYIRIPKPKYPTKCKSKIALQNRLTSPTSTTHHIHYM